MNLEIFMILQMILGDLENGCVFWDLGQKTSFLRTSKKETVTNGLFPLSF